MAGRFNLEDYDTVESRIKKFWEQFPSGRILSDVLHDSDERKVVKAFVYADREDQRPVATGVAEEIVGSSMVTKSSALEVCETSAIGRALANFLFSGNKRPSREEMEKVQRYENEPRRNLKIVKPVTPEEITRLESLILQISEISEIEKLREIYVNETEFLDTRVSNTTIKDALNKRVTEIQK